MDELSASRAITAEVRYYRFRRTLVCGPLSCRVTTQQAELLLALLEAGEHGAAWEALEMKVVGKTGPAAREHLRQITFHLRLTVQRIKAPINIQTIPGSGLVCLGAVTVIEPQTPTQQEPT